jgi:hypothetical protein
MLVSEILIQVRKYAQSYSGEKQEYTAKFVRNHITQIRTDLQCDAIDPSELADELFNYDPNAETTSELLADLKTTSHLDKFVAGMPRMLTPSELLARFDVPDIVIEVCDCEADGIPYVIIKNQSKLEFPVPPALQHTRGEVRATFDDAVMFYTATIDIIVRAVRNGVAETILEKEAEELERLVTLLRRVFPEGDTALAMARRKILENVRVRENDVTVLLHDIASKFFSERGSLAKASPSERELIRMHLDDIFV